MKDKSHSFLAIFSSKISHWEKKQGKMWKNKTYKIVQYVFMYNMNLFFHFFAEVVGSTCLFAAFFLREGMLLIFFNLR